MARTKPRRSRGQRSRAGAAVSIPDILTVGRLLLRPQVLGTLLVVLAAAALPYLLPLTGVIDDARDGIVRALGLHAFTLVVVIAAWGGLLALRRGGWIARHRRHVLGTAVAVVFSAGLLGRWYPDSQVGAVDLAASSAGGDAGRWLARDALITAGWAAMLPLGYALLWPRTTAALLRSAPFAAGRAAAWLWRLGAAQLIGRVARAPFRRGRRAVPEQELSSVIADIAGPPEPSLAEATELESAPEPEPKPESARSPAQMPMDMETPAGEWRHSSDGWQLPPIALLSEGAQAESSALDSERRARVIEETLASFGVDASVTQINEGPAVTQFGIEPGWDVRTRTVTERDASGQALLDDHGQPRTKQVEVSRTRVRVNRITALQNDLALALAAPAVRIEAPVPGKQMVGIEVPNISTTIVTLRNVMESAAFRKAAARGRLSVALGAGVSGEAVVADLANMPHLLIAGATGSGKSVCLNSIITCLLMNHSPEQLRLVLIDPKRVELTAFAKIPHLAFSEIVVDVDRVVGTLQAVINEMDSRYRRFAQAGVRDIRGYNERESGPRVPYWVVVIDELADLMIAAPYQVERQVVRIAQLARATGIHLVIATQRPSVDVVTGLIKANFPTRIAFAVASQVDSRTVIDHGGAEKLLGRGDMLFQSTDAQNPRRLQGVFVSDEETNAVVGFWTQGRFDELTPEKHDDMLRQALRQVEDQEVGSAEDEDPMVQRALDLARDARRVSTSMLQRKLRIGYPRAARIMDELEERGIVGPAEPGGSSREVMPEPEPALPGGRGPASDVASDDAPGASGG
jgi:S-DNA-T family DNA segregation ATPase FtsK/SpoIIIE